VLIVDKAEAVRVGYIKVVKPYNLEKSKALVVGFVGVVVKLHLRTL